MAKQRDTKDTDPAGERAEIGTPAGESPEEGRERHGTECLTDVCDTDDLRSRGAVEDEDEIADEDFDAEGREISTTGGITGTKVRGGVPPGGETEGGTQGEPPRRGKPAEGDR